MIKKFIMVILCVTMCCTTLAGCGCKHEWVEATCTVPRNCIKCGTTEGVAYGHIPGEWRKEEPNISAGYYRMTESCLLCGEDIDTQLVVLTSMHEDGYFLFSPNQFESRLNSAYSVLDYGFSAGMIQLQDNTLSCGVYNSTELFAAILFNNDTTEMNANEADSHELSSIMACFYTDDVSDVVPVMLGIIVTCDPTVDESYASYIGKQVVYASLNNDYYEYNGVKYALTSISGSYVFVASVLD